MGTSDLAARLAFGFRYGLRHLGLRDRQLVAGALGLGDRLRLLSDRLLDRRRETWFADEAELLDLYSYGRNLRLHALTRLAQELGFVLAVDVLQLAGGSHLIERVAYDVFQNSMRKAIQVVSAVLHVALRHLDRVDCIRHSYVCAHLLSFLAVHDILPRRPVARGLVPSSRERMYRIPARVVFSAVVDAR